MTQYKVTIIEHKYSRVFEIEADTIEQAGKKLQKMYDNQEGFGEKDFTQTVVYTTDEQGAQIGDEFTYLK